MKFKSYGSNVKQNSPVELGLLHLSIQDRNGPADPGRPPNLDFPNFSLKFYRKPIGPVLECRNTWRDFQHHDLEASRMPLGHIGAL